MARAGEASAQPPWQLVCAISSPAWAGHFRHLARPLQTVEPGREGQVLEQRQVVVEQGLVGE